MLIDLQTSKETGDIDPTIERISSLYIPYRQFHTCWQVRKSATDTNTPAITWAARVCRKIGVPSLGRSATKSLTSVVVDILSSGFTYVACVPVTPTPFIRQPAGGTQRAQNTEGLLSCGPRTTRCDVFPRLVSVTAYDERESSSRSRNFTSARTPVEEGWRGREEGTGGGGGGGGQRGRRERKRVRLA